MAVIKIGAEGEISVKLIPIRRSRPFHAKVILNDLAQFSRKEVHDDYFIFDILLAKEMALPRDKWDYKHTRKLQQAKIYELLKLL